MTTDASPHLTAREDLWLFGYGSLIWNPGFTFAERRKATLDGWALRFWQRSEDHRGTPERPGRVATLIPSVECRVVGVVYRLDGDREAILDYLDHREKGGYDRQILSVRTDLGPVKALSYIGTSQSSLFIGPETDELTAQTIRDSVGPSGKNIDYLLELQRALVDLGESDGHVDSLVRHSTGF